MAIFSKSCLETLRHRVNLLDVLSSHVEFKRQGAVHKALCPFHDEKTPSFMIQRGDTHYHCFGCGAHGDAIQFLMSFLKMNFTEAVENLAQRFNVPLDYVEQQEKGPDTKQLRDALNFACQVYHFFLMHTEEGHEAIRYLHQRGIDIEFIKRFHIGFSPTEEGIFKKMMHRKYFKNETLITAGLLRETQKGSLREFFNERIMFPIHNSSSSVIGFSGRKMRESTFGGKYVNTPETPLFKKSKVLFGLNHCRRRIAKERKVIIVEGQIDTLRLIQEGLDYTVSGQGTAFGQGHVKELMGLGVNDVYLAFDADDAGNEATYKVGDLFQRAGAVVYVVSLPKGSDPDSIIQSQGIEAFLKMLNQSKGYIHFLVNYLSQNHDSTTPAGKSQMVNTAAKQIRQWDHPLLIHESLRELAHLTQVPENMIGVGQEHIPNIYIKKSASIAHETIDPDRIMEGDFLRWLLLAGDNQKLFIEIAEANIHVDDLRNSACKKIYQTTIEGQDPSDLLSFMINLDDPEGQLLVGELMKKKVNKERAEECFKESIQKILDRNWMVKREGIKMQIQSGQYTDEEVMHLIKEFDELKCVPPVLKWIEVEKL